MNRSSQTKSNLLADPEDFKFYYESLHVQIYRFLLIRLVFDTAAAEDLTAETFLRAWRKRKSFTGTPETVKYWIYRIARNLLVDFHRKKRPLQMDENIEFSLSGEKLDDQYMIDREDAETMWRIFYDLPPGKAEVLTLRYILKWQVKDIADYLEINENTASKQIHRALQSIRDQWPTDQEMD